jgi:hypothetical protein
MKGGTASTSTMSDLFRSLKRHGHRRQKPILVSTTKLQNKSISTKAVHYFTTMMNMKLTATALERSSRPATTALEQSLRVDERMAQMQRKRMRYSLEGDNSSKSPYGMSGFWREMEDLEHTSAFPSVEWSFDDDIRVASELGSTSNDDGCIQNRHSLNTTSVAPAALAASAKTQSKISKT